MKGERERKGEIYSLICKKVERLFYLAVAVGENKLWLC